MTTHLPCLPRLAVLLLTALAAAPPAVLAERPAPARSIAAALQPFVDSGALAGAVTLVADRERVLGLDAVGFADVAAKTPLRSDALFWIASQSKPITAAALMMLVDEGKVKLDDPAANYLPELKELVVEVKKGKGPAVRGKPKTAVTVRHLLTHTSGMPFASPDERPTLDRLSLRDAVRSYARTPLLFEPGSSFRYSNAGINTVGRIIEVVSGMRYEEFLDKRLFGPLGMTDTTFWPSKEQLKRLARSYRPNRDKSALEETKVTQLHYPLDDRKRQPMPAGGLFSTAHDLARFCQMMLNEGTFGKKRLLSREAVQQMTRKQTGPGVAVNWGLGWSLGKDSFGHGGAYATSMTIDRKRGLILVFLVQHAGFPKDGGKSQDAFRKTALERFGKPK